MRVKWLNQAIKSLDAEAEYISGDSLAAAQRTVFRIKQAVRMLQTHPAVGRLGRVPGTRELVVSGTPYIVIYRVRRDRVEIVRVLHGARRWPKAF